MSGCHQHNGSSVETGVVVIASAGRTVRVQVEVVRSAKDRARGLMYRRELSPNQGMFFVFEKEEIQSFWMKNTYIPLDMLFINEQLQVVGIVESAEPLTTTSRSVPHASRYVLEVRGGFAQTHHIAAGTKVLLEGFAR